MKLFIGAIIVVIAAIIILAIVHGVQHPCISSRQQVVRHTAWTEWQTHFFGSRRTRVPIYHAAYDSLERVCDKYK